MAGKNPIVMRVLQAIVTIITIISAIVTIAGFVHQLPSFQIKAIRKEHSKAAPIVYTVTKNEIVTILRRTVLVPGRICDSKLRMKIKKLSTGYIAKRTTVKTIETGSTSAAEDDGLE